MHFTDVNDKFAYLPTECKFGPVPPGIVPGGVTPPLPPVVTGLYLPMRSCHYEGVFVGVRTGSTAS